MGEQRGRESSERRSLHAIGRQEANDSKVEKQFLTCVLEPSYGYLQSAPSTTKSAPARGHHARDSGMGSAATMRRWRPSRHTRPVRRMIREISAPHVTTENVPSVSVVMSTYNRGQLLETAIRSVLAQHEPTPSFELIIVDNN